MRTRVAHRDRAADGVGPLEVRTRPAASLTSLIRLLSFVVVLLSSVSSGPATETVVSGEGWLGHAPFTARLRSSRSPTMELTLSWASHAALTQEAEPQEL